LTPPMVGGAHSAGDHRRSGTLSQVPDAEDPPSRAGRPEPLLTRLKGYSMRQVIHDGFPMTRFGALGAEPTPQKPRLASPNRATLLQGARRRCGPDFVEGSIRERALASKMPQSLSINGRSFRNLPRRMRRPPLKQLAVHPEDQQRPINGATMSKCHDGGTALGPHLC
jgi:hypothetical protein